MTKSAIRFPKTPPRSILLLKGHSAGIGDLLRSSAAWRALHDHFPAAQLHLWFLTRDPGASSEQLIGRHHLLAGFRVSDKRTGAAVTWRQLFREARQVARQTRPDLIVDFEPNGLRTSLLARWIGFWRRAPTVGIAQAPLRGWFYNRSAPSTKGYARRRGLSVPLEYAERDFVALAALGIERCGTAIELRETEEGRSFRQRLSVDLAGRQLLGLNIGCGTPDALGKRPPLDLLSALVGELQQRHKFALVLTGAAFEQDVNSQFLSRFQARGPVVDLAGRTSLLELTGVIKACSLFVSSDSGPYHMSVALRVPTLALFKSPNPEHYHHHHWTQCLEAPSLESLPAAIEAAERLLHVSPPALPA
ncbi:MAG TPA: glycosyltransferase family 9 protein [Candidatus Acidoferrum sp.]|jgi:ADP-heptose:LPS heptosyltransferase|nr:glycosyltransferase family 9 protein [Candidatus Acidoferrum sp.]